MDASSAEPGYFTQAQMSASNQPPQIFGNFAADGSMITPTLPAGSYFADDPNSFFTSEDGHDQNDPKRRRIARACDSCRKKKIKCDGKMPACTHCQNAKTECIFTHVEKKRNPPKGAKYIEALENRLGRMESLLRMSGLFDKDDEANTDLGALEQRLAQQAVGHSESPNSRTDHSRKSSQVPEPTISSPRRSEDRQIPTPNSGKLSPPVPAEKPAKPEKKEKEKEKELITRKIDQKTSEVETLSDMMCSLVTNTHGETRYIGSSSGFSIFSPRGIQWVNEKTGDRSFEKMIYDAALDDNKWYHWRPEIFGDIFARRVFKELPPRHECLSLLKDFFENFNMLFPLFHEPTFMHLVDRQYSDDPYDSSGWWASLNVALAISYRLRVMSNLNPGDEDSAAWAYFKNALAVQTELTLRNTDLLSVQALLGMALFLQGTPNPQPTFTLVAAAIRLAHGIGLHKRGSGFGLNAVEIEQRKRVFWIAYLVDKDISLRSGRPPSQDEEDWNVELPSEDPDDDVGNVPLSDGKGKCNLFRLMCTFGLILGKVYRQLYSVKASKQSDGELLNTIGELDKELEEWKDSIPIDFRPEHEIHACNSALVMHVVCLHFSYYNCLTTIHRMAVHHGYWTSRLSNYAMQGLNVRPLNPRVFSSAALCVSAARASINLVKYIPQGDYACVWLILYYPVSSLVTLFANILQNPQDARARSDLKLMHVVTNFLSKICSEESTGSLHRTYAICTEFERISSVVLSKAEREMSVRQKRKAEKEREKAETKTHTERHGLHSPQQQNFNTPIDHLRSGTNGLEPSASAQQAQLIAQQQQQQAQLQPQQHLDPSYTPNSNESTAASHRNLSPQPPQNGPWLSDLSKIDFTSGLPESPSMSHFVSGMDTQGSSMDGFGTGNSPAAAATSPLAFQNSFQQPFVPQELWNMPMTFEWDWAGVGDMGGGMGMGMGMPGMGGMALDDPMNNNNSNGNSNMFGNHGGQ